GLLPVVEISAPFWFTLAAMPSAVVTPVEALNVRLFWTVEDATTRLVTVPLTLPVRPLMLPSAVFNSAWVETCPGPVPHGMVVVGPPLAEIGRVEVPAVPPAATIRSSRLVEL